MLQTQVSNPNDFKVVSFHNSEEFGFTPEMGCMYDGCPINGKAGSPGIDAGETVILPYHVGHLLAKNLAKRVLNTSPAATVDAAGVPTGVPIWSADKLDQLAKTYIKELYTEEKAIAPTQTELLLAKVEEYKKLVEEKLGPLTPKVEEPKVEGDVKIEQPEKTVQSEAKPIVFQDKQEVIAELEKRGIKFDRRASKVTLEKLLA